MHKPAKDSQNIFEALESKDCFFKLQIGFHHYEERLTHNNVFAG